MSFDRMLRINETIKQNISLILMREIEDPRIRNNFVTITKVETTKDLKEAKVFFICINENSKEEVLKGFKAAKGVIFSKLKKSLSIRYTPNLTFLYDKALIETNKVLENIHNLDIKEENNNDNEKEI